MDYSIEKVIEKILNTADMSDEERRFGEKIKEIIYFIKTQNLEKSYVKGEESLEDIIYNYIIEWAVWSLVMQSERMEGSEREIYGGFCMQISNTLLSIYKLTTDGLDYQAMCLVRVLLEMCITFLAILLDDNVKKSYWQTKDLTKEREIWMKNLRYNQILKIVLNYCKEVAGEVFKENPEAEKMYGEMYQELSRYEHNSYLNIFMFNYVGVEDETLAHNLHGNKVTRIKMIFNEVLKIIIFTHSLFFRLLIKENILPEVDIEEGNFFDELQGLAIALHYMNETLLYKYWEKVEEEGVY